MPPGGNVALNIVIQATDKDAAAKIQVLRKAAQDLGATFKQTNSGLGQAQQSAQKAAASIHLLTTAEAEARVAAQAHNREMLAMARAHQGVASSSRSLEESLKRAFGSIREQAGKGISDLSASLGGGNLAGVVGSIGALASAESLANPIMLAGAAAAAAFATALAGVGAAAMIARNGLEMAGLLEQARLGMAGELVANAKITTAGGGTLTQEQQFAAGLAIADEQLHKMQTDAAQTGVDIRALVEGMNLTGASALRAGITFDQLRGDLTSMMVLARTLNVPYEQVNQTLLLILAGHIRATNRVAAFLGISQKELTVAKERGTIQDLLNEKLAKYQPLIEKSVTSAAALDERLKSAAASFSAETVGPLHEEIKKIKEELVDALTDQNSLKGLADTLRDAFSGVGEVIADTMHAALEGAKALSSWLEDHKNAVKETGDAFASTLVTLVSIVSPTMGAMLDAARQARAARANVGATPDNRLHTDGSITDILEGADLPASQKFRVSPNKELAAASTKGAAQEAEAELRRIAENTKEDEEAIRAAYDQSLLSIGEYYRRLTVIERVGLQEQIDVERKKLANANLEPEERQAILTRLAELSDEQAAVGRKNDALAVKAREELNKQVEGLSAASLRAQGKDLEAATVEIQARYGELMKRLVTEGNAAGQALVQGLINSETFRARLEDLERQAAAVKEHLSTDTALTRARVDTGDISKRAGAAALAEEYAAARAELQRLVDLMEALTAASSDPKAAEAMQRLRLEVAETNLEAAKAQKTAGQAGKDFASAIGKIFESVQAGIEHARTGADALKAITGAIVGDISRMVLKGLEQGASNALGGLLGSLFGGSSAASGAFDSLESGLAGGGPIYGPGTATSDSVPAMLSHGEYVVKASSVSRVGRGAMDHINRTGSIPRVARLAAGGLLMAAGGGAIATPAHGPVGPSVVHLNARVEKGVILEVLGSTEAQKVQLQTVNRNAKAYQSALRIPGSQG